MKKITATLILAIFHFFAFAQYTQGEGVLIEYQGEWYKGKVIEVKTPNYLISYDDYDASWNEIVSSDRLKKVDLKAGETPVSKSSTNTEETAQKSAKEMCDCLINMMKTQKQEDKSKCLKLQEIHVATLKKGTEEYLSYKKLVGECEQKITAAKNPAPKNAGTFEDKVKQVCDCFTDAKAGKRGKQECYKLQNDLSNQLKTKKYRL
jgi:hypothetical protein